MPDNIILLIISTFESTALKGGLTLMASLFGQGEAAAPAATPEMSPIQWILTSPFVLPIGLFLLFYATMIAPERRKKAEEAKLMASLKKNDRVVTIGGIHGTVVAVSPESKVVTLKVDESGNTRIKVNRSAIATVLASTPDEKETSD